MGRKKSKSKKNRPVSWETQDVHQMLGCLDFSLERTNDKHALRKAVKAHLKKSRGKKFSLEDIDAKLRDLEQGDLSAPTTRGKQSIFSKGSKMLRGLPPYDVEAIGNCKLLLSDEQQARILRSAGERNLRSTSQRVRSLSAVPQRVSYVETRGMSTSRQPSVATGTPRPSKRLLEVAIPWGSGGRGQSAKRRREMSDVSASCPIKLEESSPCLDRGPSPESRSIADSESPGTDPDPEVETAGSKPSLQLPDAHLQDSAMMENIMLQEQVEGLAQDLDAAVREIENLKAQLLESRAMHETTSHLLRHAREKHEAAHETALSLRTALSEVSYGLVGGDVGEKLAYQGRKIMSLERLLEQTKSSASFANLAVADSHGATDREIQTAMGSIDTEIRKLRVSLPRDTMFSVPPLEGSDRLSALVRRSLALQPEQCLSGTPLTGILQLLGRKATICTLTAVSVTEWVLEDDFERAVLGSSKLLDAYRHHLALVGQNESLRNLDLAANSSFFQSEEYQGIWIPGHARTLATRLAHTLAPLFRSPDEPDNSPAPPAWGLDPEDWDMVDHGLVDIFQHALRLKADLLSSTHRYVAVFFPPLAEFVHDWMQPGSKNGDRAIQVPEGGTELQLCVLPALFAHVEGSLEPVDHRVRVLTDVPDDDSLRLVRKGVVILSPTDSSPSSSIREEETAH